jgi:hypothetical protein
MEDFAMFDEVACEEIYNEEWARWMDELEMEAVNAELQVIADEQKTAQVEVEADAFYLV